LHTGVKEALINLTVMQLQKIKAPTRIIMSLAAICAASLITSCQKDSKVAPTSASIAAADSSASSIALNPNNGKTHHNGSGSTTTTTTPPTTTTTTPPTTTTTTPVTSPVGTVTSLASLVFSSASTINLNGASGQTISGKSISGGSVPCISLTNCHDMHITQNKLQSSTTVGILLTNCYNITIDYNFITDVSTGVYAASCSGGGIVINYNQFRNMKGPYPRGQFVQFNNISGAGLSISYNKCENILGASYPEDAISLYMSNGIASSPIKVVGNWIRGGGPSKTGGGICVGDNGGSYQYIADNILVNPGQYGIGITGGDHHSVINNQIFASQQSFTNVGIDIYSQAGNLSVLPTVTNATVSGNQVNWTNSAGVLNPDWIGPGDATPAGWSTNTWNAGITTSILPTTLLDL
jgi:hypothetical protein